MVAFAFFLAGVLSTLVLAFWMYWSVSAMTEFFKIYKSNCFKGNVFFGFNDELNRLWIISICIVIVLLIVVSGLVSFSPGINSFLDIFMGLKFGYTVFIAISLSLPVALSIFRMPKIIIVKDAIWYTDSSVFRHHNWKDIRQVTIQQTGKVVMTNSGKIRYKESEIPKRSHITIFLSNKQYVTIENIHCLPTKLKSGISKYCSVPIKIYKL